MKNDLQHLHYHQSFHTNAIFTEEIVDRLIHILLGKQGKWEFLNICLWPLEVIEVTEVNMCANQSISVQASTIRRSLASIMSKAGIWQFYKLLTCIQEWPLLRSLNDLRIPFICWKLLERFSLPTQVQVWPLQPYNRPQKAEI